MTIAFELVDRGTDPNELGKVIAFVRQNRSESDIKGQTDIVSTTVIKQSKRTYPKSSDTTILS